MNRNKVRNYIDEYKNNFQRVHKEEIYKWKAVNQFQNNFDINSNDLHENLSISLSKSENLLTSGKYFPKNMLLENTEKEPEKVRNLLRALYNEDLDFLRRIETFRSEFKKLNKSIFPNKLNDYQDHRAVIAYLALMYPERYFLYKFGMFKDFAKKIEFTYKPKRGRIENVGQFHYLCQLLRYEIENDQELIKIHESRLEDDCYRDRNFNILTQDFIYAVVRHLDSPKNKEDDVDVDEIVLSKIVESDELKIQNPKLSFTPKMTNHIQNNIENKRIGDLGEIWVLKQQKRSLESNGRSDLAEKVKHVAKNEGDGLGYDILSYDLDGKAIYIEVKTTKGSKNSTFFITRNELEKVKLKV